MREKKRYLYGLFFAILFAVLFVPAMSVNAANPTTKTLKTGKTYSSYDITGDKKADKIKISTKSAGNGWMKGATVKINGKTCYTYSSNSVYFDNVSAKLYTLKNGKNFLYLCTTTEDDMATSCKLLQYKSGKLKTVINFYKTMSKFGSPTWQNKVVKVKGNSMIVQFGVNSYTTSNSTFRYTYKYKNGTLKRTSTKTSTIKLNFGRGGNIFTTAKKLTSYSSPSSKKTSTLAKGTKVKITNACLKNGKLYLKYKKTSNGKTGWIKCYTKYHSKDVFKNLYWSD